MPRATPVAPVHDHRRAHLLARRQRADGHAGHGRPGHRRRPGGRRRRHGRRHAHHRRPDRAGEPAPLPDGHLAPRGHPRAAVGEEALRRGHPPGPRRERRRGDVPRPGHRAGRTTPSSRRPRSCTTTTCPACPSSSDGALVGIIARSDILRAIIAEPGSLRRGGRPGRTAVSRAPTWAEVDLVAVAHNVRRCGRRRTGRACARWSRPTATATARSPVAERRWTPAPRGWPSRWSRRAPSCATPASTPRSCVLSEPRRRRRRRWPRLDLEPTVYTEAGIAAARPTARGPAHGRRPLPVHLKVDTGMHRVGCRPRRRRRAWPRPWPPSPSCAWRRCGPTARWPTSRTTRSPPSSSTASRRARRARGGRASTSRCATPPTRPAPSPHPARRFDLVRVRASPLYGIAPVARRRPASSTCDRPCASCRTCLAVKRGGRRRGAQLRPALPARPPTSIDRHRPRSATPTACRRALSALPAARCSSAAAGARSPAPSPWTSSWSTAATTTVRRRRRGRAARPAGRRGGHRRGVGRAPRHHRLRDRLRHRPARPRRLPAGPNEPTRCETTRSARGGRRRAVGGGWRSRAWPPARRSPRGMRHRDGSRRSTRCSTVPDDVMPPHDRHPRRRQAAPDRAG